MKINKFMFVPVALTTVIAPISITSCSGKLPSINKMEVRQAYCMTIDPNTTSVENLKFIKTDYWINVIHFNDSPVGYVDVENFFYCSGMSGTDKPYTVSTHGKVITATNNFNKSYAKIDFKAQTITIDDYDSFLCHSNRDNPVMPGAIGGEKYWKEVKNVQYIKGNAITIDLDYYNIPAYFKLGRGYLPMQLFKNMFNFAYHMFGEYNGVNIYPQVNRGSIESQYILKMLEIIRTEGKKAGCYTKDYFEFAYNLLALTLDLRFGISQRQSRVTPGKIIKYLPDGAYKAMEQYHDALVSTNDNVSNDALLKLFSTELDDGGHARYSNLNITSTKDYEGHPDWGEETALSFEIEEKMEALRNTAGISEEQTTASGRKISVVKEPYKEYEKDGNKIAYITFDSFAFEEDRKNWTQKEKEDGRELPSGTKQSNYMNDTLRLTMYANEQIQANNIKNVVIDISCNGGGEALAESFIASWVCNGITWKIHNPKTGSYSEFTVKADINADGQFNDQDRLAADVNLYVISSSASFSCGNLLPCQICDYRPSAKIIGERSGGGCCVVDSNLYTGWGSYYRSSGLMHLLRGFSTPQYRTSNDSGCEIHYFISDRNDTERAKYYDRTTINNWIWSK